MCFSAEASFAGGVIISAIGVATVRKIQKPSQIVFASIPLFFGVQQMAEGFLWLTIPHPEYAAIQKFVTILFLIMALVIWPMMIPFSVLLMEEVKKKRRILWGLLIMGAALSLYYSSCLITCHVTPEISGFHVQYKNDFPDSVAVLAFTVYLFATIVPLFVSSVKRIYIMGIFMFMSCFISAVFFTQYLTSVWCFFAAIISGIVYWILNEYKKEFNINMSDLLKKIIKINN